MGRHSRPVVVSADLRSLLGSLPTDVHPLTAPCPCPGCSACNELPASVREKGMLSLDTGHTQNSIYIDFIHNYHGVQKHCPGGRITGGTTSGLYYDSPHRDEIFRKIAYKWYIDPPPKVRRGRSYPATSESSVCSPSLSSPKSRKFPTKVAGAAGVALWRLVLEALMELRVANADEIADYIRKSYPAITKRRVSTELGRNRDKGFEQVGGRWGYWRLTPHVTKVAPPVGIPITCFIVPQRMASLKLSSGFNPHGTSLPPSPTQLPPSSIPTPTSPALPSSQPQTPESIPDLRSSVNYAHSAANQRITSSSMGIHSLSFQVWGGETGAGAIVADDEEREGQGLLEIDACSLAFDPGEPWIPPFHRLKADQTASGDRKDDQ